MENNPFLRIKRKIQENNNYENPIIVSLTNYLQGTTNCPIFLVGSSGSGKTFCIENAAKACNFEVRIFDPDEEEDIRTFLETGSLHTCKTLYVFDRIEEYQGTQTKDLGKYILKINKKIVLTTNDLYECSKTVRDAATILKMPQLTESQFCSILQRFALEELHVEVPLNALQNAFLQSPTDIRYAKTMLQYAIDTSKAKKPGHKSVMVAQDIQYDLFGSLQKCLTKDVSFSGIQSNDLFLLSSMIQSNTPKFSSKITPCFDALSMFNIMETTNGFYTDFLGDFLFQTVITFKLSSQPIRLEMPKIVNVSAKLQRQLQLASKLNSLEITNVYDTLNVIRLQVPPKLTSKNLWYDEDPEIREIRKKSRLI